MAPVPWPVAMSLLAAVGTLFLVAHLRQYREKPGANWFLASLCCQTAWSLAYGVALLVTDPVVLTAVIDAGVESPLEHGSGLGLWLANWRATTLGGKLTLESGDDGTTVAVTLPESGRRGPSERTDSA